MLRAFEDFKGLLFTRFSGSKLLGQGFLVGKVPIERTNRPSHHHSGFHVVWETHWRRACAGG